MSELRKVKLSFKEDLIRKTAEKLGYEIKEKQKIDTFATRNIIGDLVLKRGYIEFGFVEDEIVYDNMFSDYVSEFVAHYVAEQLIEKGLNPNIIRTHKQYVVTVNPY